MSVIEQALAQAPAQPFRRPLRKRVMHAVRRAHLYCGLFLLPWAVLYGVTGFLFNHPSAFADVPTATFGAGELAGTPMQAPPKPDAVAEQVVAALNARAGGAPYALIDSAKARYTRDFAFATVKTEGATVSLLFDVNAPGGTVRANPAAPPKEAPAPFAIDPAAPARAPMAGGGGTFGPTPGPRSPADIAPPPLILSDSLASRVRAAVPVVLDRTGFPKGEVTVTSVPDLTFLMSDGAKTWRVTYNGLSGSVSGASTDSAPAPEGLSTRRFLTRLHLAHGFPGATNTRWVWAVFVDAMALVLVFWGVSGLFMWWQVKATRWPGLVVLHLSAAAATALGVGMFAALAPK